MRVLFCSSYASSKSIAHKKTESRNGSDLKSSNISFGRALTKDEQPLFTSDINQALSVLDKRVTIIMPDRCNPCLADENIGIGSPFSSGAKKLTKFFKSIGVTGKQKDPSGGLRPSYVKKLDVKDDPASGLYVDNMGYLRPFDPSPYISTEDGNELYISLKALTNPASGSLLSKETLQRIVDNNPTKGTTGINFEYINSHMKEALEEVYSNFTHKRSNLAGMSDRDRKIIILMDERFEHFKQTNAEYLEKESLYAALSKENGTDIWTMWSELDKTLPNNPNSQASQDRIADIHKRYARDIDFYKFKQFLLSEQGARKLKYDKALGITSIADEKVATSDVGIWANQNLFLDDYSLGCPPDAFADGGQPWGFPVFDPAKIVDKDGNLSEAGKFLYNKYKKIFSENKGGVRIDHVVGLIDPFVYPKGKLPTDSAAGRLYSSPQDEGLGKYAKETTDQYAVILKKIIIPAAQEAGVDLSSIICEDLGTLTPPVVEVMKELQMPGVRVTEFVNPENPDDIYRGKNVDAKNIIMAGSHDNDTLVSYAEDLKKSGEIRKHAQFLAQDLMPNVDAQERNEFAQEISEDPYKFAAAKFAELFVSPARHVQVFIKDLLGNDPSRYNFPGTTGGKNWNYVLKEDFDDEYFNESLPQNKGLNMPQALSTALKARGQDKELIKKLDKWADIMREPAV